MHIWSKKAYCCLIYLVICVFRPYGYRCEQSVNVTAFLVPAPFAAAGGRCLSSVRSVTISCGASTRPFAWWVGMMGNRSSPLIRTPLPWMRTSSSIQLSHLISVRPIKGPVQKAHRVVCVTAQRRGLEAVTACAVVKDLQTTHWNMRKTVCVGFTGAARFSARDVLWERTSASACEVEELWNRIASVIWASDLWKQVLFLMVHWLLQTISISQVGVWACDI